MNLSKTGLQGSVVVVSRMVWYAVHACDWSERVDHMVTVTIPCRHCGRAEITTYGLAPNGKQQYRCRACGRQRREHPAPNGYTSARREEVLHATQERSSLRGLERTFGIARSTIIRWQKKLNPSLP